MQLLQIYQPFMSAVSLLSEGCAPSQPDNLRQQLMGLLAQAEEAVIKQGWPRVWSTEAAFAICVWADERLLLSSHHSGAPRWVPLQSQLHQTYCGGEEFFSRLETLFSRYAMIGQQQLTRVMLDDVLRVFGICLATGFRGCYYNDESHLDQLRQRIVNQLGIAPGASPFETLVEEATPRPVALYWRLFDPFSLVLMGMALLITLLAMLVYQDLLTTDLLSWP